MEKKSVTEARPPLVTWTCIVFFAAGIFNIIYSFTGVYAGYGVLYSAANVLLIIISFAALSGVWAMERWGVLLFTVIILLKIGLDLAVKAFSLPEILLLIPAGIMFYWYKKMK